MFNAAKITSTAAFAALLISGVFTGQSASAANGPVQHIRESVSWTLSPAVCSSIPLPLSGTGERNKTIHLRDLGGGASHRTTIDSVQGFASDANGSYHFLYKNRIEEVIQANGVIKVHMFDRFMLNYRGGDKLQVDIEATWSYSEPSPVWPPGPDFQFINLVGDPSCDPI